MSPEQQTMPQPNERGLSSRIRRLFGEDVFVSYARADGLKYATALANTLTRRGFACRIDQYDTLPGIDLPPRLRRAISRCRMMVVVASEQAWLSKHVGLEVAEFLRPPTRGQLIIISFGDTPASAVWRDRAAGLPLNSESLASLSSGTPTASIVDLVANSFQFQRRNRRMLKIFAGLVAAIGVTVLFGLFLLGQLGTQLIRLGVERDRVVKDLRVQQAEVTRQTGVSEALQSLNDADVRRRSRGYASPSDLLAVLEASATLRDAGRQAEAQAALADALSLQPRLKAAIPGVNIWGAVGVIASGQRVVLGGAPTRVVDFATGKEVMSLPEHALSIAVSADGARFLTVSRPGDFVVRDARSFEVLGRWSCEVTVFHPQFALAPDGTAALATCGGGVQLIDVHTGDLKRTFPQRDYVSDLRLGRADGYVAIVNNFGDDMDYRLSLFKATDGTPIPGGRCGAPFGAYVIDPYVERIASGCDTAGLVGDSDMCRMEVCRTGAEHADYSVPTQARSSTIFSNDGRRLATSEGGLVHVWDARDGAPVSSLSLRVESMELRFSDGGAHLAGLTEGFVWVIDAGTGDLLQVVDVPPSSHLVALAGDGKALIAGASSSAPAYLWEATALVRPISSTFAGAATGASFSPDGRYLIASGREVRASDTDWFRVVDRTSLEQVAHLSNNDPDDEREERVEYARTLDEYRNNGSDAGELESLRSSLPPRASFELVDGGRLALVSSGLDVALWDLHKRAAVALSERVKSQSRPVLTTDGRYLEARGSRVVDLQSGKVVFETDRDVLGISRSGLAATGEFGLVRISRMATGELEARIRVRYQPKAVTFSPDEKEIAIAAGPRVETWLWRLGDLMGQVCSLIAENQAAAPWTSLTTAPAYRRICATAGQAR